MTQKLYTYKLVPILTVIFIIVISLFNRCSPSTPGHSPESEPQEDLDRVEWTEVDTINLSSINKDIVPGKLTVDVGIYFPSNLDSSFNKVSLKRLVESFVFAKEIYVPTGVQLNLLWVKTGAVDPSYFALQSNQIPGIPDTEYANMYENSRRHPAKITDHTKEAFQSIIEPNPNNHRTIYLVVLEDVFYPFLTVSEGRNWMIKTVRTGGLSFPSYSYVDQIPLEMRGVITVTNLSRGDRYRKTVAHEIGHKLINVSHEYKTTNPGFEVFDDGGLMLYGEGEDIPSGKDGRWHLERLLLSPYLYTVNKDGERTWNAEYQEGGHYYDPIYGNYVVRFPGVSPIDEDW